MRTVIKTDLIDTILVCLCATLICPFLFVCYINVFIGFSSCSYIYLLCFFVAFIIFDVLIMLARIKNSRYELILYEEKIILKERSKTIEVPLDRIIKIVYYKCKWYFVPFVWLYKNGNAGFLQIYTHNKKYSRRILYCDYIKLSKHLQIIEI